MEENIQNLIELHKMAKKWNFNINSSKILWNSINFLLQRWCKIAASTVPKLKDLSDILDYLYYYKCVWMEEGPLTPPISAQQCSKPIILVETRIDCKGIGFFFSCESVISLQHGKIL